LTDFDKALRKAIAAVFPSNDIHWGDSFHTLYNCRKWLRTHGAASDAVGVIMTIVQRLCEANSHQQFETEYAAALKIFQ
jgi:hypothetical protein